MKIYNIAYSGLAALALFAFASCEEDRNYNIYEDPTDVAFSVKATDFEFKGNATQAQVIDVTSAVSPTVTYNGEWRISAIEDFTPNYNFRYNILPKASLENRTQTITIKSGKEEKVINVHQTPADPGFLGLGWNLGNHFDTSDMTYGYWDGATPSADLYAGLAAAGFNSVRIPATWTNHMDDNNVIDNAYLAEVATNVDNAISAGLKVILNTHHDSFETTLGEALKSEEDSIKCADLIKTLWSQVATYFADRDNNLMFETFNEVHDGDDWGKGSDALFAMLNNWNQIAVDAIRAAGGNNTSRWIGVAGYAANADLAMANLELPKDAANKLAVSIHCYDPYNFCIEASVNEWGKDEEKASIEDYMFKVVDKYLNAGIPVYIGEFGCSRRADDANEPARLEWLKYFTNKARTYGLSLFVWDNNANNGGNESHAYIDHSTGKALDAAAEAAIKAITDGYNNK